MARTGFGMRELGTIFGLGRRAVDTILSNDDILMAMNPIFEVLCAILRPILAAHKGPFVYVRHGDLESVEIHDVVKDPGDGPDLEDLRDRLEMVSEMRDQR